MSWRRNINLRVLGRILVLLLLLAQSALLIHEAGHANQVGDVKCQVCLHAQPHVTGSSTAPLLAINPVVIHTTVAQFEQPVIFAPFYANSSRGPPVLSLT